MAKQIRFTVLWKLFKCFIRWLGYAFKFDWLTEGVGNAALDEAVLLFFNAWFGFGFVY